MVVWNVLGWTDRASDPNSYVVYLYDVVYVWRKYLFMANERKQILLLPSWKMEDITLKNPAEQQ